MMTLRASETLTITPSQWRNSAEIGDIRKLAEWLDTKFVVPGTNWRFGLDSIIGIIPGVGDAVTTLLGAYIIVRARELGAPLHLQAAMAGNLAIDTIVGAVPVFGDIFDFAYRSHAKNVRLLLRHIEKREGSA